jgi:pyruvate-ferredoxin/flavodoxin oxidoreductase
VKGSQFLQPLFEYSGACAGCGETPYIKLLTQLFGDRDVIANATGCSSIYGGNLPRRRTRQPRGPRPGLGELALRGQRRVRPRHRLALDALRTRGTVLSAGSDPRRRVSSPRCSTPSSRRPRRHRRPARAGGGAQAAPERDTRRRRPLLALADHLVKKSVWIVGGDGWAYDIGYGGSTTSSTDADVNILVLDTEVYSNTGGQQSKATPLGRRPSSPRPASRSEEGPRLLAMGYGTAYVAQVAFGAKEPRR